MDSNVTFASVILNRTCAGLFFHCFIRIIQPDHSIALNNFLVPCIIYLQLILEQYGFELLIHAFVHLYMDFFQ